MSDTALKGPSRGRLFKLFTDIGPYFRKLQSDEGTFFFDCLEICVDDKEEPENRTFLGWWLLVTRTGNTFQYKRYNGLYDIQGNWVEATINKKQMQQLDQSFTHFTDKLSVLIDNEIGCKLTAA
ncbi:sigma factor-binding protein Crl [Psychromonas sp. RZ22]|uniref:sigma factor-binding protein Crl n=1 Tax=Psychromonas algarum TaxID=2555643 RepID=UPI0010675451|nr:sigma factor-binding protein Crl [Psychromonas sp. RZ22]TEW56684.1 sigma factor-binding protein Crl [Psychromonas sp. RZ22]